MGISEQLFPNECFLYAPGPETVQVLGIQGAFEVHVLVLPILSRFIGGRTAERVAHSIATWFENAPGDRRGNIEIALEFLNLLKLEGMLTPVPPRRSTTPLVDLKSLSIIPVPEDPLINRSGLVLRARADGFVAFDPHTGREIVISGLGLITLLAFARGRRVDELPPENQDWARRLYCAKILASAPNQPVPAKSHRRKGSIALASWSKPSVLSFYTDTTSTASHLPLALGMVIAYAQAYDAGSVQRAFDFRPITSDAQQLQYDLDRCGPSIVLFSNYIWCERTHLNLSRELKKRSPFSITIHGGPCVPKYLQACDDFMRENTHVDIAVRGEGEVALRELLLRLAEPLAILHSRHNRGHPLTHVDLNIVGTISGITYRCGQQVIRTDDRKRTDDLDQFASPYLTNVFAPLDPELWNAAIVETNRGCPYGCTFCDWGSATLQKVRKFSLDRVKAEIEWVARQTIRVLIIADANFGIFDRDVEIASFIARMKRERGFPQDVKVNYAKNATRRLADIVRIFSEAGLSSEGVISIQTTDPRTLHHIHRSNIKTERYDELLEIFRERELPLATDLMYGLPGMNLESFKRDLQTYFDRDVQASAYATVLLANSPMANPDYLARYQIKTRVIDCQKHIVSTSTFSEAEWEEMHSLNEIYHILVNFGVLRHLLFFFQWEYGVPAVEFLHQVRRRMVDGPAGFLHLAWLIRFFRKNAAAPGGWAWLYKEIVDWAVQQFGVRHDSALETVVRVQEAVMPEEGLAFPRRLALKHDYAAYFRQNRIASVMSVRKSSPLIEHGPGMLTVADPNGVCASDRTKLNLFYFQTCTLELQSEVSRDRARPHRFING